MCDRFDEDFGALLRAGIDMDPGNDGHPRYGIPDEVEEFEESEVDSNGSEGITAVEQGNGEVDLVNLDESMPSAVSSRTGSAAPDEQPTEPER
jgi:hypothetical protein